MDAATILNCVLLELDMQLSDMCKSTGPYHGPLKCLSSLVHDVEDSLSLPSFCEDWRPSLTRNAVRTENLEEAVRYFS